MQSDEIVVRRKTTSPDRVEEVRERLAVARRRTKGALAELKYEVRSEIATRTDWHTYYRARPLIFLGAAMFVGFLFGSRR